MAQPSWQVKLTIVTKGLRQITFNFWVFSQLPHALNYDMDLIPSKIHSRLEQSTFILSCCGVKNGCCVNYFEILEF